MISRKGAKIRKEAKGHLYMSSLCALATARLSVFARNNRIKKLPE
jgi:hypothetical protein